MATTTVDAFFDGVIALIPPVARLGAHRADLYVFLWAMGGRMVLEGVAGETGTYRCIVSFFGVFWEDVRVK